MEKGELVTGYDIRTYAVCVLVSVAQMQDKDETLASPGLGLASIHLVLVLVLQQESRKSCETLLLRLDYFEILISLLLYNKHVSLDLRTT